MKNEKVRELYARLKDGVKAVLSGEKIKQVLTMQAKFRKYSFGNVMLILQQCPHATLVAGYHRWQELGRWVKKGEKAIKIFAPCPVTKTVVNSDGEEEDKQILLFKVVNVFDVSQTDGKELPLPEAGKALGSSTVGEVLWSRLIDVCPVPWRLARLSPGVHGCYHPRDQRIEISEALTVDHRAKTMAHEIAHHLAMTSGLDTAVDRLFGGQDAYARGEVIAEGAAFVFCSYFGLDTAGYSFDYVANWSRHDPEAVLKWGEAVQKVAVKLIELVEKDAKKVA